MSYATIMLFLVYCFGLGLSATFFLKNSKNFLERNLMRVGIGLALVPLLGMLLNILRLPIDWRIILILSIAYPAYDAFRKFQSNAGFGKLRITKADISIFAVLLIFLGTFYIYASGAFKYPYLEDDDPWAHAIGTKYVAMEKNLNNPYIRYIDPYPPSYDLLMGVLHQTNNSVYWTLKFFNALIISLSVIFFYFFAKEFGLGRNKALFATFALASIPCFLSHFIWGIALTMPLFFVAFYCVEMIRHDKKWWIVSGLVMVATLTSSPTHSTYFGLFFALYLGAKLIMERKIPVYHALAGTLGLSASFAVWWLPAILKYGIGGVLRKVGAGKQSVFSVAGTADRIYTFGDFAWAKTVNMINNPVGIGIVLFLLAVTALAYLGWKNKEMLKKNWVSIGALFLVANSVILFALSSTYTKYVPKRNVKALAPGSVGFFEFLSDQNFLVIGLSVTLFLAILYFVKSRDASFAEEHIGVTLLWLLFAFYAVNAGPFVVKLSPFRAWMLLAVPVCILAAEGAFFLAGIARKAGIGTAITLFLLVCGILLTSAYQKYAVNTAQWGPGGFWTSAEEIKGYLWMKGNLPPNTKVFTFTSDGAVIGMDKFTCQWCDEVREFKKKGINASASETNAFLKRNSYKYLIIGGQFARKYGVNETNEKLDELLSSGLFRIKHNVRSFILLEVA
jgi:hypothetical protein